MSNPRERFMRLALDEGYRGIRLGHGGPFGAVIVKGGRVVGRGHNRVLATHDPTQHAEVGAIHRAARLLRTHEFKGCEIYSTTEPCAMCFSAIHWAKIEKVFFGTTVLDVKRLGFNELIVSNRTLKRIGRSPVRLEPGFMAEECRELLKAWTRLPGRRTY